MIRITLETSTHIIHKNVTYNEHTFRFVTIDYRHTKKSGDPVIISPIELTFLGGDY